MEKSNFIKSSEFDGDGIVLEYIRTDVVVPNKGANGEDYGAKHTYGAGGVVTKENWLIKNNKLKEGETFKYVFKDGEQQRTFDNSSVGFWITLDKAKLAEGQKALFKRNKISNFDIKWTIEVK